LSPYDEFVKKYAKKYNFDWRLMVAQMHQESHFDPNARSFAGAHGLFQIMPRTAKQMNLENIDDPETGIHAGIKYMDWVRERMTYIKPEEGQLIWFTLASYNAGAGHVRDAVSLARKKGWNPHRWFGHVEKAMLLLSKAEYAKKARYGYVRGHEPVQYVHAIKNRFDTFQYLVE
jgi:membrane-bound lytic murein transglycosylase F